MRPRSWSRLDLQIWLQNQNDSKPFVTATDFDGVPSLAIGALAFSPDGTRLAFQAAVAPESTTLPGFGGGSRVWVKAKLFTRGVPGMFVSSRLAYGVVEKVLDISHNRSMADLEVGYFVTPSFRAFGMANAQQTHGGIDFPINGQAGLKPVLVPVHDVIQRVNYLNLGGGFAYSLTDSLDMFASFSREATGRNGHVLNRGITLGASWSFSRRSKGDATAAGTGAPWRQHAGMTPAKRETSLGRCICQKSGN